MSDTLLDALRTRIVAEAGLDEAAVHISRAAAVPETDAAVVIVRAAGGPGAMRTHNGGELRERLVQITVRALDAAAAAATAEAVRDACNTGTEFRAAGLRLLMVRPVQDLLDLPLDGNGRALVAFRIQARYADAP